MSRLILYLCIVFALACKSNEKKFDSATYEKTKETLEEKEKKNPEQFLSVTSSDKKNIIGQKVIRLSIHNRATVATYKDVKLKISFYSKTGTLLEDNEETVYDIITPNNTIKYKTKYFAPKGTDDVKITILDAKVEG